MIKISGGHNLWWSAHIDLQKKPCDSRFDILFNHTSVQSMSFQQAADYTAKLIANKFNNLFVAMSGGLDSAFVAEVLYRNNIPFTPIIGIIASNDDGANCDYFRAMFWCEERNIKPMVIKYTPDDPRLIKQIMLVYNKLKQISDGGAIQLALNEQVKLLNGHLITGNPTIANRTIGNEYFNSIGSMFDTDWISFYCDIFNTNDQTTCFFFYTPELVLGFAKEIDTTVNESVAKTKLYNIPYCIKTLPDSNALLQDTLDKLYHLYQVDIYSEIPTKVWNKEDLIKELVK